MSTTIKVIGCGNAFSHKNFHQSFLIEENGKRMLIDCGSKIPDALHKQKIDLKSIDAIYISHQHGDHCGGLEEFAFNRYDWQNKPSHFSQGNYAPKIYANSNLMKDLWEHSLSGGLKSMEGFDATLETYFEPILIKPNETFIFESWKFSLVQQVHIMTGSVIMSSFGLFMEKTSGEGKKVYFTTDAQYFQPEQVKVFYDKADLVFQDCEVVGCNTTNKTMVFKSGVHANYGQLAGWDSVNGYRMDPKHKKKLYLSHYQDCVSEGKDFFGNQCDWDKQIKEDGLGGFCKVGMEFKI